jgi:3-phosphoglycerate kinase
MNSIKDIDLKNKRVFLRADLNVPLKTFGETLRQAQGERDFVLQDFRLQKILPTIDYIQKNGGKVILGTHIGRPSAKSKTNFFDKNLSTELLIPWFKERKYKITHELDLKKAVECSKQNSEEILLLPNLRFFNGEKETNNDFAKLLAQTADVYINDAFAVMHRNDTSVSLLPQQFEPQNRGIGLLVEKEIEELSKLKTNPEQPFVLVVGGNKITDKVKMFEHLLEQSDAKRIKAILIGGALANTFLKAKNFEIGKSLYEEGGIETARRFLQKAEKYNVKVLLPTDMRTSEEKIYTIQSIKKSDTILDIGPETEKLFAKEIARAKTIFMNGTMGKYEAIEFAQGTKSVLKSISESDSYSVIGGGDAVAAAHLFDYADKFNFLSTGGGATLAFLSSKEHIKDLPGFNALN